MKNIEYTERVPKMKANQRMIYHLCVRRGNCQVALDGFSESLVGRREKRMLKDMLSLPRKFHAVSSSSLFRLFKFKFQRDCFHNSALPPLSPRHPRPFTHCGYHLDLDIFRR